MDMPVNVDNWMDVLDQYDPSAELTETVHTVITEDTRRALAEMGLEVRDER